MKNVINTYPVKYSIYRTSLISCHTIHVAGTCDEHLIDGNGAITLNL